MLCKDLFELLESRRLLATFTVTTTTDSGAGSLRQAVADANAAAGADVIEFAASLAGQTITLGGGDIQVSSDLSIQGLGADRLTISGGGLSRVFSFTDGNPATHEAVSLSGVTLTGGLEFNGGAINIELGAAVVITGCVIANNSSTGWGGGIALVDGSSLTLRNSAVIANSASEDGGGIFAQNSDLVLENCTIANNTAATWGGGIGAFTTTPTSVLIRHCTITGNTADSDGNATGFGGGVHPGWGTWVVTNTIVSGNLDTNSSTPDDASGTRLSSTTSFNNIIGHAASAGGLTNGVGGNQLGVDPLLGSLGSYGGTTQTFPISATSPALNAGIVIGGIDSDQRGAPFSRASGIPDIGAYERQVISVTVSSVTDEHDSDYSQGDLSLREALALTNANAGLSDTILFSVIGTIPLAGSQLTISDAVTVTGPGANRLTIDGGNSSRILYVSDGDAGTSEVVIVSGLTFLDGAVSGGNGGGILVDMGAALTLDSCTITSCTTNNAGGGIGVIASSTLAVNDSALVDNQSTGDGGAIFSHMSTLVVQNTTISGNRSNAWGGGIGAFTTVPTSVTVRNSTISGNIADNDNNGTGVGGGVDGRWGSWTLISTIVYGNFNSSSPTSDDISGTIGGAATANNLVGDAATSGGLTNGQNGNVVGANPLLGPLGFYGGPTQMFSLLVGSPAIDAGLNPAGLSSDQRGSRFGRANGTPDIGAYERQSLTLAVTIATDDDNGNYSNSDLSLREAVTLANANLGLADTITFIVTGTIVLSRELTLSDTVSLTGNGASFLTVSGGNASGIFFVSPGSTATISSLTLSQGTGHSTADGTQGGAIYNGGVLTLANTVISASTASRGGGIYNAGTLTVTGGSITGNTGDLHGGGLFNTGTATLTNVSPISSNFVSDPAGDGGGIFNAGTLTMTGGSLSANSAPDSGGGLFNDAGDSSTLSSVSIGQNSAGDFDSGQGGGVRNAGTMTLSGCTISENTAFEGGGITNSGTVSLDSVTISGNSTADAGLGGGVLNLDGGTLNLTGSTVSSNTSATRGGGIENLGTATITNSTISQNGAEVGGGISHSAGTLTLLNSTLNGNTAQSGAGIRANAQLTVRQSTFAENSATGDGSAIIVLGGATTVTNSTIAHNTADSDGNGVGQGGIAVAGGALSLSSSIVDDNSRGDQVSIGSDIALLNGSVDPASANNLIGSAGSSGGLNHGVNGNLVGVDARLGVFGVHGGLTRTYSLLLGSPAINAGTNPDALTTDQRGYSRVGGSAIDIGAFETGVYPINAGAGRSVYGATDSSNAHRVVTVNPNGDVIVFEEGWTVANLQELTGSAKAIGDAILWIDPKDNLVYVAAPTEPGLLLFARAANGSWSVRNLTQELSASPLPTHGLVHIISTNNVVIVAGVTAGNEIVVFQQTLETADGGGPEFAFVNITGQLTSQGMSTPVLTNLIGFVTAWNTWHFAGIDNAGEIHAIWIDVATFTEWRTDNLSSQYAAAPVQGQLAVTLTPWGGINLTGLDSAGNLLTTWWVPGNPWLNSSLTQSAGGGTFSGGLITGYGTPWGGINYVGLEASGEVVGYWWAPSEDVWHTGAILPADVPDSHLPTGSLTSHPSAAGTLNIFGATDSGDVIRMWWEPEATAWTADDLTEVGVRT